VDLRPLRTQVAAPLAAIRVSSHDDPELAEDVLQEVPTAGPGPAGHKTVVWTKTARLCATDAHQRSGLVASQWGRVEARRTLSWTGIPIRWLWSIGADDPARAEPTAGPAAGGGRPALLRDLTHEQIGRGSRLPGGTVRIHIHRA